MGEGKIRQKGMARTTFLTIKFLSMNRLCLRGGPVSLKKSSIGLGCRKTSITSLAVGELANEM